MHAVLFDTAIWPDQIHEDAELLTAVKSQQAQAYQQLETLFEQGQLVESLIHARSDFIDTLLTHCWDFFFPSKAGDLSLIAVGGYGRQELLPHSDIDLLVLGSDDDLTTQQEQLTSFITFLWDCKLDIGHSVRTIDECTTLASSDITIATNLMESRTICGNTELLPTLMTLVTPEKIWPSAEFFKAKWEEQIARHKKFNNTEYNLEPNVKSSPGGLRDIQMIGWIAKRHFNAANMDELVTQGFLSHEEYDIMVHGHSFLLKVRFCLHLITNREEDRLLFEYQRTVAKKLGYKDDNSNRCIEEMMKQYYRWALALTELNDMIMQLFDESILKACVAEEIREINPRFRIRNQYIEVTNDRVFEQSPSALLEIFVIMAQTDGIEGVRATTIRLIRENRHQINDDFRNDARNIQLFNELLRSPRRIASQFKLMKRYGILGKYIPAFGQIIGQTQLDLFHIYTVDAHTIMVLKNMRRFTYEDMREKFPIATQVVRRIEQKELLYLACLFHDIGKGRGGDHSVLGAQDAYQFCRKHGYNYRDSNLVSWLVKYHLYMSHTSQKKDLSDPDVIRKFALKMGDQRHLDFLFALTVADINGTNPALWTSWRASLMRQLYSETKRALRRGLENITDKQELIEEKQAAALQRLNEMNANIPLIELLWSNAGDDYFLRESINDIVWQTDAISKNMSSTTPLVLVRESNDVIFNDATQIFLHTRNNIHTFAVVAAVMEQLHLSIVDARIYSSNSGYTLDTFLVQDADGGPVDLSGGFKEKIQSSLIEYLTCDDDFKTVIKKRTPRQLKFFSIPTYTSMTHNTGKNYSALEVIAADRPGLLACIGDIFVEFDIELINAKIATMGERVEDIFFITNKDGQAIDDEQVCLDIQQAIRERLDAQVAQSS
ncbi:MAG: [protein-PII] uridylyltransferase [Pseudomonadales bacterium]|nr:[protein-PII] uridylyltransferase [Pseudomonadales bacterium]